MSTPNVQIVVSKYYFWEMVLWDWLMESTQWTWYILLCQKTSKLCINGDMHKNPESVLE